jgi:hypothetical protein
VSRPEGAYPAEGRHGLLVTWAGRETGLSSEVSVPVVTGIRPCDVPELWCAFVLTDHARTVVVHRPSAAHGHRRVESLSRYRRARPAPATDGVASAGTRSPQAARTRLLAVPSASGPNRQRCQWCSTYPVAALGVRSERLWICIRALFRCTKLHCI